jgi:hypothetical protein
VVAEALRKIHRVSLDRSRRLYDLTLLAVRRDLLNVRKLRPVDPSELTSRTAKPLLRYRSRLGPLEFARLVFLTRNLSPATLLEEFSLEEVLYGFPDEEPLFGAISSS